MSHRSAGLTQNSWDWSRRRRSCLRRRTSSSTSSSPSSSSPSSSCSSSWPSSSCCTAWSSTSWGREASQNCWRSRPPPAVIEEKSVLDIVGEQRMTQNKQTYAPALPYLPYQQIAKNQAKPNQTWGQESFNPRVKPRQDKNMFSCAKPIMELLHQRTHYLMALPGSLEIRTDGWICSWSVDLVDPPYHFFNITH